MPGPIVSLDRRVADALVAKEHEIENIRALLTEVTSAIGSIGAEYTHCMARSLDPCIVDEEAKSRAEKANHMLTRLNAALPRLQKIHADLIAAAKLTAWNKELKELVVVRDEIANRFRERYCACAAEIVGLFDQVKWCDEQIDSLHSRAHAAGAQQRMRMTEPSARGFDHFGANTKPISEVVRLPMFGLGSGDPGLAWPKATMPLSLAMMAGMGVPSSAPPPTDEERIERSRQLAEQGAERERGRERLNAEAADAERARRQA
jgi:hypothetical protein